MTDFAAARRLMVDGQVRTADVTDFGLLAAMLELPRERFFPEGKTALAYLDLDVPVGEARPGAPARRLLKPMVLAKLIQVAGVNETDRVLDVGCATGYATALLARLAQSVIGLEEDEALARAAGAALAGTANARIVTGPLSRGVPGEAPFDVILVEGSCEQVPAALFDQLKNGGRLACVIGHGPGKATIYRRVAGDLSPRVVFDAAAAPLPGFAKPPQFVF